eukprot:CAMPEP_0201523172 /NCGR_PEP_ID=MMETSP0161_2-20130828/18850_1 /ASSEMBLY_ACC=CAM_ASM_000251 /TAXON_ID=180227 /ORGANISM="Neoparamoeba aestuarina, Strain SoJaBio B1-5/56/2" /LENGTH=136 /DNA_ID=CAMNT_0047922191 /DNA_START=72 /DNA_END=482 /DNA_ORIENTATION=+
MAFSVTERKKLPSLNIGETAKKLGAMWHKLTAAEKSVWTQKAAELQKIRQEKIARGEIIVKVKQPKPKGCKPVSAYICFGMEKRKEILNANPSIKNTEILKKIGGLWRQLSDAQKNVYQEKARKLNAERASSVKPQ